MAQLKSDKYVDATTARSELLAFVERVAGPRERVRPELAFAIQALSDAIPWNALGIEGKKEAARAMRALKQLKSEMIQMGIIVRMFWEDGDGGETSDS